VDITNYGLVILGAIYAVKLSGVPHSQTYLKVLAGATAVLGSIFLLRVQYNIAGIRWRLVGASWHIGAEVWSLLFL
jgi:ABC-type spermidine/putrescine transport system permease subunit II